MRGGDPFLRQGILTRDGHHVTIASGGEEALTAIRGGQFDVVLTDLVMPDVDGLLILEEARAHDPDIEVILMTGHGSVDSAIGAIKRGAFHYLEKPLRPDEVRSLVRQAGGKCSLGRRVRHLEHELKFGGVARIVGASPAIEAIRRLIVQIRQSDSNVLVTGESGTGKELVARAIHECRGPRSRSFCP